MNSIFFGENGQETIQYYPEVSGSYLRQDLYITGSRGLDFSSEVIFDDRTMDKLVARMMVHTSKVITPCKWCGSHNAFSNPTCVKCGGPLG